MNIRGWILYLFLTMLQNKTIEITGWTNDSHSNDVCWYQYLLRGRKKTYNCYGRSFDFSDHIVLFYAHILSAILFETFFWFVIPIWSWNISRSHGKSQSGTLLFPRYISEKLATICIITISSYIYFLTSHAAFKTAAYFHTPSEIVIGYFISMFVQMPLAYTMCSEDWVKIRKFVGISSFQENND